MRAIKFFSEKIAFNRPALWFVIYMLIAAPIAIGTGNGLLALTIGTLSASLITLVIDLAVLALKSLWKWKQQQRA